MHGVIAQQNVAAVGDRGERGIVALKAGAVDHRGLFANQRGQLLFDLHVDVEGPIQEARPTAPAAVPAHGFLCRGLHLGMVGQSQVVVRTEHQDFAAPQADLAWAAALVPFENLEPNV